MIVSTFYAADTDHLMNSLLRRNTEHDIDIMRNCDDDDVVVPTIIEIAPRREIELMDYEFYTDAEDDTSLTEEDDDCRHLFQRQQNENEPDYDVSHQDLDALKRMVRDMLANPDLLHTSPVYSKISVTSTRNPISPNHVALVPSPASERSAGAMVSSSRRSFGISVTPMQDIAIYLCQECSSSDHDVPSALRPLEMHPPSSLIQKIPTMPFR